MGGGWWWTGQHTHIHTITTHQTPCHAGTLPRSQNNFRQMRIVDGIFFPLVTFLPLVGNLDPAPPHSGSQSDGAFVMGPRGRWWSRGSRTGFKAVHSFCWSSAGHPCRPPKATSIVCVPSQQRCQLRSSVATPGASVQGSHAAPPSFLCLNLDGAHGGRGFSFRADDLVLPHVPCIMKSTW